MPNEPRQQYPDSTSACWYPVTIPANTSQIVVSGRAPWQVKIYAVFLSGLSGFIPEVTFLDGNTPFNGTSYVPFLTLDLEQKPMICSVGNDFIIESTGDMAGMVFAAVN